VLAKDISFVQYLRDPASGGLLLKISSRGDPAGQPGLVFRLRSEPELVQLVRAVQCLVKQQRGGVVESEQSILRRRRRGPGASRRASRRTARAATRC